MGGVAVLHPQDCLKDHRDHLFSTPKKSRRTIIFNPTYKNPPSRTRNFTVSDSRRRTPPKGIFKKNDRNQEAMVAEPSAAKNLVMGHVKLLKRGEALNESSTSLNDVNHRNGAASTPEKDLVADREVARASIGSQRVFPTKKKAETAQNRISNLSPKVEVSKAEEFALSSTYRLGPDPEMLSKQMKKNTREFFAGSAFADSPPPSAVPLPGFFTNNLVAAVRDDPTTDLRRILGLSLS